MGQNQIPRSQELGVNDFVVKLDENSALFHPQWIIRSTLFEKTTPHPYPEADRMNFAIPFQDF
jgi:hypothetical protein